MSSKPFRAYRAGMPGIISRSSEEVNCSKPVPVPERSDGAVPVLWHISTRHLLSCYCCLWVVSLLDLSLVRLPNLTRQSAVA
ncbi:hypothetical protein J6590_009907 [Homalodisca vitripennis]|nr:hypothetical protein J6590_009907 [Homalodisca vitripennis]